MTHAEEKTAVNGTVLERCAYCLFAVGML